MKENFALTATGYLKIDTAGTYTFHIWSDDGTLVDIGDQRVMDNDHARCAQIDLLGGMHVQVGVVPIGTRFVQDRECRRPSSSRRNWGVGPTVIGGGNVQAMPMQSRGIRQ